jgi:hypothetical protein
MVIRTFLDKCNTIKKDSIDNFGLTPVIMLNYGLLTSRCLVHFNETDILSKYDDKTFGNAELVTHRLKMKNCASINSSAINEPVPSEDINKLKKRASSFDLILFRIPRPWDAGVGFDNYNDIWYKGDKAHSSDGSNWFNAQTGNEWDTPGIISLEELDREVIKYYNGEDSIIITHQHFDFGNEDLDADITSYINGLREDKFRNYGIGIAFAPSYENKGSNMFLTNYVGFFSNHTNTFFEPYIESRYDFRINDNKYSFYPHRTNHIYFSASTDGEMLNLDHCPTFIINGKEYTAKQATKGMYYAEVKLEEKPNKIIDYTVNNIVFDGTDLGEFEDSFTVLPNTSHIIFNDISSDKAYKEYSITVYPIENHGNLISGDVIRVMIECHENYNNSKNVVLENAEYRLYIGSGTREVDVISWDYINTLEQANYFFLDTNTLVPNEYHLDIRCKLNGGVKIFKNKLTFNIVNEPKKEYKKPLILK